jgi:hypothetical protein
MLKFGVTAEKIVEVLEKNESVVEIKTVEDVLCLRNKDFSNMKSVFILYLP